MTLRQCRSRELRVRRRNARRRLPQRRPLRRRDDDGRQVRRDEHVRQRAGRTLPNGRAAGLAAQLGGLNAIHGDYDNNGCQDILILRGGWEEIPQRKSLLRNNCDGTFTDVTVASGLATPTTSQTAVWTDIDNDGRLDLFVGVENGPAQLFHNKGDGTFVDIASTAGVDRTAYAKGVAWLRA